MAKITINSIVDDFSPVGISQLGTAVFDNVVFFADRWTDAVGNEYAEVEVKLDSVAVVVSRKKHIVKSQIAGVTGEVKEYVCANDYSIKIDAIITPQLYNASDLAGLGIGLNPVAQAISGGLGFSKHADPTDQMINISKLEKVPESVQIRSKFLNNIFSIQRVVMNGINVERNGADGYNVSFDCDSDEYIDLSYFG